MICAHELVVQLFRWNVHIEEERSVSTGPARGNTVDGLPRASKFWVPNDPLGKDFSKWLVETEIAFSVEEQLFIGTTAGQIHFKSACAFSKHFGTKS